MSLSVLFHALGFVGEPVVGGWVVLQLTDSLVRVTFALRLTPFLITGLPGRG